MEIKWLNNYYKRTQSKCTARYIERVNVQKNLICTISTNDMLLLFVFFDYSIWRLVSLRAIRKPRAQNYDFDEKSKAREKRDVFSIPSIVKRTFIVPVIFGLFFSPELLHRSFFSPFFSNVKRKRDKMNAYMNKKCEFWIVTNHESRIVWPHP